MPQKIKNEKGEEVEVFSAEELASRAEERAKEIAKEQVSEVADQFEADKLELENRAKAAEDALAKDSEELKKLKEKDFNFRELEKKSKLTPEQEAEAKKTAERMKELETTVDEIKKQPLEAARTSFIDSNFDPEDKEQRDLFEFFYKKIAVGAKTMEEVNKALVAAFNATTGGQRQPSRIGQISRTSVSDNYNGNNDSGRESEASREFGAMLGVSTEDKKRFSETVRTGSVNLFSKNLPKKS